MVYPSWNIYHTAGLLFDLKIDLTSNGIIDHAYTGVGADAWTDTVGQANGVLGSGMQTLWGDGLAVAYSLRNLSDSYTGHVVEVRRSGDDAVRSFMAAEVTDGTLLAWVNEVLETTSPNVGWQGDSIGYTPEPNGGFSATNAATGSRKVYRADYFSPTFRKTPVSTVTFTISNLSGGSIQVRLNDGQYDTGVLGQTITEDGTYTQVWDQQTYLTISPQGSSVSFTLDNFSGKQTANGMVSKWYDQSGNDNHATENDSGVVGRIVENGVQCLEDGKPTIKNDDAAQFLVLDKPIIGGDTSTFAVYKTTVGGSYI
jgi:hypothetical protein